MRARREACLRCDASVCTRRVRHTTSTNINIPHARTLRINSMRSCTNPLRGSLIRVHLDGSCSSHPRRRYMARNIESREGQARIALQLGRNTDTTPQCGLAMAPSFPTASAPEPGPPAPPPPRPVSGEHVSHEAFISLHKLVLRPWCAIRPPRAQRIRRVAVSLTFSRSASSGAAARSLMEIVA